MTPLTKTKVFNLIQLNEITDPHDPKIEGIADRFPDEYKNDQEYVDFQIEISEMIYG